MVATKRYVFNLFFNFNEGDKAQGRAWAEEKREGALIYLRRLFENKARFSCIAKDEKKHGSCLMLRGYMNLDRLVHRATLRDYWESTVHANPIILEIRLVCVDLFTLTGTKLLLVDYEVRVGRLRTSSHSPVTLDLLLRSCLTPLTRRISNRETKAPILIGLINPNE